MLHSAADIEQCTIGAMDGPVGRVTDCYFDAEAWVIRYLVVETGDWLSRRKVLISPIAIGHADWTDKVLPVSITKARIKDSPDIDTDRPLSRQHEKSFLAYHGYPCYWRDGDVEGGDAYPHLHSVNTVMNYHIHATDGDMGHVRGLLVDEKSWSIRFMVVDTNNWWAGNQVLIAPEWIDDVRWANARVVVDLTRDAVKESPSYDADIPLTHAEEAGIYKHYEQPGSNANP